MHSDKVKSFFSAVMALQEDQGVLTSHKGACQEDNLHVHSIIELYYPISKQINS